MTATGNELVTLNQLKMYGGGHLKINGENFLLRSDSEDTYQAHVGNISFENSLPSDQGRHENWNRIDLIVDGKNAYDTAMLRVQGSTDDGTRGDVSLAVESNNAYVLLDAHRISEDAYRIISNRAGGRPAFSIQKLSSSFKAGEGYTYDIDDEMDFAATDSDFAEYFGLSKG